jgi:CubicO group peptidase (beta-lactamase class C family)
VVHFVTAVYKDGKLVLEEYFYGYDQGRPHQLRSATKSVVSAMAGVALRSGALRSVDEPVISHMRYANYNNPDPRKATITMRNLLTMQPGFDCNDHSDTSPGRETLINEQPDWVKATLDLPMISAPGQGGNYCSGGVAVAGRMTENIMGKPLPVLAQQYLFGPLGIRSGDWRWNYNLDNSNKEYSQIHLRPRDMLKFGVLYANGGVWRGRRILSREFVRDSLSAQSEIDGKRYGYFWWNPWIAVQTPNGEVRVDYNAAQGNGGQKIYLFPQYGLVAVITAGAYNQQTPSNSLMARAVLPTLIARANR